MFEFNYIVVKRANKSATINRYLYNIDDRVNLGENE